MLGETERGAVCLGEIGRYTYVWIFTPQERKLNRNPGEETKKKNQKTTPGMREKSTSVHQDHWALQGHLELRRRARTGVSSPNPAYSCLFSLTKDPRLI